MPLLGRSYQPFIVVLGLWIVVVFVVVARLTHAERSRVNVALVGGALAGAANVALDAIAHHFEWWRYPEATTPFGPLVYYVESGLGFAAFAVLSMWLRQRFGVNAVAVFAVALCVYGPIRDHRTQELIGLIEFRSGAGVVLADALFEWLIPFVIAFGVTARGASLQSARG